ncbi:MAG: CHAT domain-containing protein [Saprospiraceae bacterium]|nr:CHAT domain-containing protein [Saprospiraceae bacterium]MDZ4703066.1 CHAT domain-containing protein [Saprospiraceae bacterium]
MTINDIRNLIRKGDLDKAIDALFLVADKLRDQDLSDNVTLQSSRYHKNENDNNNGVVGSDFYARTRAQVATALQSYLNNITDVNVTIDMPMPGWDRVPVVPENGITGTTGTGNGGGTGTGDGRTTILILASNPSGTGILQVEREHSRISNKIQESDHADAFRIRSKKAVTLSEFQEYLYDERPTIVHFSGHGEKSNPEVQDVIRRGLNLGGDTGQPAPQDDTGIILYDESKRSPFFVGTAVIKRIFKTIVEHQGIPIKAVLFNSCYSEAQAQALATVVPYVIGTSWSVRDDAAIAFATGFYSGIARGEDIRSACDFGINQALAYGEPEDRFVLYENGEKVVW